jgi:multiple antibiotic resistance protein
MSVWFRDAINEFVMMWVLIDPIGTIPVFLKVTAHMSVEHRSMIAVRSVVIAAVVLVVFLVGGQLLLNALGIALPSFQIAGGIVLFLFALTMIFGPLKTEQEKEELQTVEGARSVAVFPLAMPAIASPGAMMGVVLLNDTQHFTLAGTALNLGIIGSILLITLAFMFMARPILALIGDAGLNVLGRVAGLLLAAVAVDAVLVAVSQFFAISGISARGIL